jgi:NAD(P)-dependent dehydrogenase (short-subunit alcohol dehydrogenase family)
MRFDKLLEGKGVIITGAASGIGRATAHLFAEHGANLLLADLRETELRRVAEAIQAQGGQAIAVTVDVGRMSDIENMVSAGEQIWKAPDVVFSNAASYVMGTADEISESQWDSTLSICLKATWMIGHLVLPAMCRNGGGSFIVTSSVHALRGYRRYAAYQAAKGGLDALTRSMAADFAPGVRVNSILPGAVVTGLWDGISEEERGKIALQCPLQRNADPKEVALVALFLASDMSSYITGQRIVVDGGLSAVSGL